MYAYQSFLSAMLLGLFTSDSENCLGIEMILMDQEFIWTLRFDIPGCQCVGRKILDIERDNCLRSAGHRGCKYMAIFGMAGRHIESRRSDAAVFD